MTVLLAAKFMKIWLVAMLSAVCVLTGCQSPKTISSSGGAEPQYMRNNCYSQLHQLLAEQSDVSLLRFIKPEHADVKILIKKIATTSATGATLLEQFAKDDPTIKLDDISLPPSEVTTRDAVASTKENEMLGQTGDRFELNLLLTQTEALSYGRHLAAVASLNEPQPDRARALVGIGVDMDKLYHEVFALLQAKTRASDTNSPATNPIDSQTAPASTNSVPNFQTLMIDSSSMPVDAGTATLIIGSLQRTNGVYSGNYQIKVFPYFLKNENGTLAINVSDESLAMINRGKVAAITGTATTTGKGERGRPIEATATPIDVNRGNLKLWFMAGTRKMTFEPAYHFPGKNATAALAQSVVIQP
jgi:hypothetical protein